MHKHTKMIKKLQLEHLKFGIPLLIILFLAILPRTSAFQSAPADVSVAILLDLLITVPIVYFLIIRKTKIPKFTVIYPFLIGILIAGFIIPLEHQALLSKVKFFAVPLIEVGLVSILIYKIIQLNKSFKNQANNENDFYDNLLIACNEIFPGRVGRILATEISVFYYLFATKKKAEIQENEFTYFKKNGIKTVLVVILFVLLIEAFAMHLLLAKWNETVAWVVTLLSIYAMFQILSILKSLNKRLLSINYHTKTLHLRYGFASQTYIPFEHIERIEKTTKTLEDKEHIKLSAFDMLDAHNIIIHLNQKHTIDRIYGIQKSYKSIALFVDDKDVFVGKIEEIIESDGQ